MFVMRPARQRGFSLLGLSIALFVLAVVGALVTPTAIHRLRTHRVRALIADLQQFGGILQQHAHDHGDWPAAATAAGAFPPGLEQALASTNWSKSTPIGGQYVWLVDTLQRGQRVRAAIGVVSTPSNPVAMNKSLANELLAQAKQSPSIGWRLRLGFRNEPIYVLEQ